MYTAFAIIYLIYGQDPGWMYKASAVEIITAICLIYFERRSRKRG